MSHTVPAASLPVGTVTGVDEYAVGNNGCLVCPWHGSTYDVSTGRMVGGPQGVFARIPGLGMSFKALTQVFPLRRGAIEKRGAALDID